MNISELRKFFLATVMALAALMMLPACSSTEEAPPPEETGGTGDTGVPCDVDMMQPGCSKEDVDL